MRIEDVKLEHLCREPIAANKNDPNDFPGSCVRLKGHDGKCQKIKNGMNEAKAMHITAQDPMDQEHINR